MASKRLVPLNKLAEATDGVKTPSVTTSRATFPREEGKLPHMLQQCRGSGVDGSAVMISGKLIFNKNISKNDKNRLTKDKSCDTMRAQYPGREMNPVMEDIYVNCTYDVAIVGAGPAGAILAKELACEKADLRILLIDGQSEDNSKPCGGLLAPDAQKALAKFDLTLPKHILADPQIFTVETIDLEKKLVKYYQRHYLNMDRFAFDRWLLSLVPSCVEIVSARCLSVSSEEGTYILELLRGGERTRVSSHFVVGADGGGSVVRRSLFKSRMKQYVSIQQWFKNDGQRLPYYSCIFDPETSDSCSWTIHKDEYVVFGGAFEKNGCREAFEKQKTRLEKFLGSGFGEAVKTEACLVSSPRRMGDFILGGCGAFLVGEAAGLISSSSFEGISSALLSAKALAEAFSEESSPGGILRAYKRKTFKLRLKLRMKNPKRAILCSPLLRYFIMKSGIQSVKKY